MDSYIIGKIEGRWTNFTPPIQGGTFRPYTEGCEDEEEDGKEESNQSSASEQSSEPTSPIFEPVDVDGLRRRRMSNPSSASSVSSIEPDELDLDAKPSFLDVRTKREIMLDIEKYPSLDFESQDSIVGKYRTLRKRLYAEGLFNCNYRSYFIETLRYTLLFSLFIITLRIGWYGTSGAFLGALWHQLVFTVHDAGHMGITHNFTIDTSIGILIADFIGGLSVGWWKRNHNVHHIVTNSTEHDPDIQHVPFFAISHKFFNSLWSTYYEKTMAYDAFARFFLRYQNYLYYPVLTLGRFNLYVLSWTYLITGQGPRKGMAWWTRWFEIIGQVFFWTWFGYGVLYCTIPTGWDRFKFVMISHMITMPLHVQITLSHFAMSTADLGVHESFPQKMLRTTMDVDCPQWLDFFHGGLQFQAIHHLFPRMPRHNLRRAQKLVQEFCEEVGIPYALYGFVDGNREVIGRLRDVGQQAQILRECQKVAAEKGVYHEH